MMKKVVLLGSTGSIGRQTLDIVEQFPNDLQVIGLAAANNRTLLADQAERFGVKKTVLFADQGMEGLIELATLKEADIVVVAVAGVIGLLPTFEAIRAGKHIALASKEVLVAAGEIVMPLLKENNVTMTPVDSEHSAIFQCLQGYQADQIEKLILTASGGPFRGRSRRELQGVTVADALNHPTWNMGGKITLDSATLMNKGLEMVEAKWLFGVEIDQVDAVLHPQSVIHSMVQFRDGSVLGQLGWPDMRLPIAYALLYPDRKPNQLKPWNPVETPNLTFDEPDYDTFRCLNLAKQSARIGGTMPAAMNAANEHVANAFLAGRGSFLGIADAVDYVMQEHLTLPTTLDSIVETDRWAREQAETFLRAHE